MLSEHCELVNMRCLLSEMIRPHGNQLSDAIRPSRYHFKNTQSKFYTKNPCGWQKLSDRTLVQLQLWKSATRVLKERYFFLMVVQERLDEEGKILFCKSRTIQRFSYQTFCHFKNFNGADNGDKWLHLNNSWNKNRVKKFPPS